MKCYECGREGAVVVTLAGALCVGCWLRQLKRLLEHVDLQM